MLKKEFHKVYNVHARHGRVSIQTKILLCTLALAILMLVLELSMLLENGIMSFGSQLEILPSDGESVYNDKSMESQWADEVDKADLVHLSLLHEACLTYKNSVIPWTYGVNGDVGNSSVLIHKDDPYLLEKMRQCPDVDIFLPLGIRGHGYCEDSIAYTKYLESRMLSAWAIEMKYMNKTTGEVFSYHDLCPRTPMIFLNHYWDGIPDSPDWPKTKSLYLMPNIEMYELRPEHYWAVDIVLCKTAICARRVTKWYQQEGNPRQTKVLYTRHTSSDVATLAKTRLGEDSIKPKNWSDVQFIHAVGTSVQKGTRSVLDCWVNRPEFPPLHVYMHEDVYEGNLKKHYESKIRESQVSLHVGRAGADDFGKIIAESAFFVCTSLQEGYGHYINQARASGAVIVSTDLPPMNEFLTPESGVLIPVERWAFKEQMLGGKYKEEHGLKNVQGFTAILKGSGVCEAVERVLAMTPIEREAMATRAKQQYFIDLNFFASKMKELRDIARAGNKPMLRSSKKSNEA
ncbi:homeobox and-type helix-turn-helix domain-containing protein [Plasmopara halstedii]|uniref:Homeobox and-type helix-turn-helix domain-containing protein n=1 Tax=Plasmopara halstedii TaxID=4781 RepID=A0A0P1B6F9_PLAHL|nr:homeobox and-type helix-turn-helix domain-containing protein [Plasmopara halstedii]CEG50424.1 homeobox and-type helix-turn-helix domain-containing protein [Plasmopara halstedii]|eukprot:XP_024586793.1 homeobox and-type helix-turn-helix domain-containing protein [Plasmopara halstedii]